MANSKKYIPLSVVDDEEEGEVADDVHHSLSRISEEKEETKHEEDYDDEEQLIMDEVDEEYKDNKIFQLQKSYADIKMIKTSPRSPSSTPNSCITPPISKQTSMADHFPSLHRSKIKKQRSKLQKYATLRVNSQDLTEDECHLLEDQIDMLLETDLQQQVLSDLLTLYPKLNDSFRMVSGEQAQAAFVVKMIRKGYIYIYNRQYDEIYNIFTRHPNYGIKSEYISSSFAIIYKHVLKHKTIRTSSDNTLIQRSEIVWKKANNLLTDLMNRAYKFDTKLKHKKKKSLKDLKRNRERIGRSMSEEDIECVVSIWKRMIEDNKEKVGEILGHRLNILCIYSVYISLDEQ